ncbi:PulJ/GspJ family protein [Kribbella catacumbae]|uniref:PulJ/GspJ family protein n=1 Tax=Kribbella catacumbae TaxID=460086 RepID=UPI000360C931|nr:prepilin-type N-terminal cleavage/methylation domain-containing protein [Kribbella catacumbae]
MHLKRSERGFTLIEVLITMTLMGVVSLALSGLVITALKQMSATSDRLDLSQDEQLGAVYFARDVAAVGLRDYGAAIGGGSLPFKPSIQLGAADDSGGTTCGPLPDSVLRLLSDDWDLTAAPPARRTAVVAYYLKPVDRVFELHRARCVGSSTPSSDVRLSENVKPGSVSVSCSTPCTAVVAPLSVTLRYMATKPSSGDHEVVLTGLRRQS